jgi:hypothetical protein
VFNFSQITNHYTSNTSKHIIEKMHFLLSLATIIVAICNITAAHPLHAPYDAIDQCLSEHNSICGNVEPPNVHEIEPREHRDDDDDDDDDDSWFGDDDDTWPEIACSFESKNC